MSEIRENRLTGEWVIIAPERAKRGGNLASATERVVVPPFLASCMFCAGNEAATADERFRLDGEDGRWVLRSVVNKFSVLSSTGEVARTGCGAPAEVSVNGVGLHEVLIESPRHDVTMALCPVVHVQRILETYRHRFLEFYTDPRVRHVIVFKNHGADAGASQPHPLRRSSASRSFRARSSNGSNEPVGSLPIAANAWPAHSLRRSASRRAGSSPRTRSLWRSFRMPRFRRIICG